MTRVDPEQVSPHEIATWSPDGSDGRMVQVNLWAKKEMGEERNGRAPNAVDRRIGERVRARRLEIGMSQEVLADRLGITFQQVQKYEKGINRIAASRLLDISAVLEMPVADFFEGLVSSRAKPARPRRG